MKSYKSIYIFLLTLFMVSCDDFLDVTPADRIDASAFFANDQELLLGVNGVYLAQRQLYADGSVYNIFEGRSDNTGFDHTDQAERTATDIFTEVPGNLLLDLTWASSYNIINLANLVISRGPGTEGNAGRINRIIGEAKFIRAMTYFYMVTIWGDIPLRTTPTEDFADTIFPRSSVTDVFNQIVQDLTEASAALPASYDGSAGNEVGRVTSYAALTLLGKVELQRGNAPAAVSALRQVEGKYSLLPNFGDIHAAGNNNTAESIFEVSFDPGNQTGLGRAIGYIPNSVAVALGIVAGGNTRAILFPFVTQDLVDAFDDPADLRIPSTFGIEPGVEPGGYITKFIDLSAASAGADVNVVLLRYADVLLMLAEALGEGAEAYALINQVRTRAGLPDIDAATPGTFMEKLMKERRLELALEMHRWHDLRRLPDAEAAAIINAQLTTQQAFFTQFPNYAGPTTFNLTSDRLLYPIPETEISISGGEVTQNPGH